jgi:hypothetical protein
MLRDVGIYHAAGYTVLVISRVLKNARIVLHR